MNKKLIILCGPSNSGKSTYSSKLIQERPDIYARVNRDKLREMLYSYTEEEVRKYYDRPDIHFLEKQISDIEKNLILLLIQHKNVIVDSTHLKAKYLNRFDLFQFPDIEIVFFSPSLNECIRRNNLRNRKVDEYIIREQHKQYKELREFLTSNSLKFDYICKEHDER